MNCGPPEMIEECFVEDFGPIEPNDDRVKTLCDNVYSIYIAEDAKFPPTMWAAYSTSFMWTMNACEAFHSKLNGMFYHGHPNIFVLLVLKVQEFSNIKKMRAPLPSNDPQNLKEIFISETMVK